MLYRFHTGNEAMEVSEWVAERITGCERGFGPCAALAVGNPVCGAVVFHNYSPECGVIEMSAAAESPRWLSRPVLWAMHAYIFVDAGCQMAVMRVSEQNKRMLRIARAFGYQAHEIPRLRGRDEAEIILTLTDDDWKAGRFYGQTQGTSTPRP